MESKQMTELCKCGEPADGLGPNTCQMCWEQHCADTYWDQHNAMVQADIALFEVHARERCMNLSRMLGCNDYFDDSTQAACIAWLAAKEQAAQQKEGYVLVPVMFDEEMMKGAILSITDAGYSATVEQMQILMGACQGAIKAYASKAQEAE